MTAPVQGNAAYSCEYDGGITLPTQPTRSGYTFGGWRVGASAAQCVLSQYLPEGDGIDWDPQYVKWEPLNGADGYTMADEFEDENLISGLEAGEWSVTFNEGTLKGRALCSGLSGNNHGEQWGSNSADWTSTESALLSASGEHMHCWCAGTDFGNSCHVASPSWVFYSSIADCANNCAINCARNMYGHFSFQRAVFGVTKYKKRPVWVVFFNL